MTVTNSTQPAVPQTQIPAGTDGAADASGAKTPATADAPVIQGVGIYITENVDGVQRKSGVDKTNAPSKTVDINEVPELDDEDVRGLVEILEDLEKLIAELKGESTEEQIAATKERIANLKSKLQQQFAERTSKIKDSMDKLDEANKAKAIQEASKWMNIAFAVVGAVLAVAAAVATVVTAGGALGICLAVVACVGAAAATASAGLSIYQEANADSIKQEIKDKAAEYRGQGMTASQAMKKATEEVTDKFLKASIALSAISMVCGIAGGAGGTGGVAALSTIQSVVSGLGIGSGAFGIWASKNATEANYNAQQSEADLQKLEALLSKLKKALEENSDEIKVLLQALMEAMSELTQLLESAQETTDQIAGEMGATA